MRHDGCDGGIASGHGLQHYAHAGVPDRGLPVSDSVDHDHLQSPSQPGDTVCVLSYQLGTDFCGASAVLPGGIWQDTAAEGKINGTIDPT